MTDYALFVKMGGRWYFQGITDNLDKRNEFLRSVSEDIENTKNLNEELRTTQAFWVNLPINDSMFYAMPESLRREVRSEAVEDSKEEEYKDRFPHPKKYVRKDVNGGPIITTLTLERVTPHKALYKGNFGEAIDTLYITKDALKKQGRRGYPKSVTLTVELSEDYTEM